MPIDVRYAKYMTHLCTVHYERCSNLWAETTSACLLTSIFMTYPFSDTPTSSSNKYDFPRDVVQVASFERGHVGLVRGRLGTETILDRCALIFNHLCMYWADERRGCG